MFERILVPLDGSDTAEAILPRFLPYLRNQSSEILLVRAVPPPMGSEALQSDQIDRTYRDAERYMAERKERLAKDGHTVRTVVQYGSAADTILAIAREEKASLIAMSTHGRSGMFRAVYGSVAEQVLRSSSIPVFLSRTVNGARPAAGPPRSILVPVDGSPVSLSILPHIPDMAKPFGAGVILLSVREPDEEEDGQDEKKLMAYAGEKIAREGIPLESIEVNGDAADRILATARARNADLIAMGTHGRGGVSRMFLGSVTESILRASDIPLLVVKASKPAVTTR